MELADTLRQRATKQNQVWTGTATLIPKKEKTRLQDHTKRQWGLFKARWKTCIDYASSRGEFDCDVYELTPYDMPRAADGTWQEYRSCTRSPDVSIITLTRTGRKVFSFLKKNGLSPELRVYRTASHRWVACILATWR